MYIYILQMNNYKFLKMNLRRNDTNGNVRKNLPDGTILIVPTMVKNNFWFGYKIVNKEYTIKAKFLEGELSQPLEIILNVQELGKPIKSIIIVLENVSILGNNRIPIIDGYVLKGQPFTVENKEDNMFEWQVNPTARNYVDSLFCRVKSTPSQSRQSQQQSQSTPSQSTPSQSRPSQSRPSQQQSQSRQSYQRKQSLTPREIEINKVYSLLEEYNVTREMNYQQIDKMRKKMVLQLHPDKFPYDLNKEKTEKFQEINGAFEILLKYKQNYGGKMNRTRRRRK